MFKIDKSTWDQMSPNKAKIIKQWVPAPHEINEDTFKSESLDSVAKTERLNQQNPIGLKNRDEIIECALKEAVEIKKKAFEEGYNVGIEKSQKKFAETREKLSSHLETVLNEIKDNEMRLNEELEDKTLKLSINIAEKILNTKLENDDKVFVGMVKNTLSMMDEDDKFIIRLNNREYEKHFKNMCEDLQKELQCEVPITIVKDVSVRAGGCILESGKSFIDASVDTQLKRVANSLIQRDTQYHEAL